MGWRTETSQILHVQPTPMNPGNKKKHGKARPGFARGSWRDKIHPTFAAWCYVQRRNRALGKIKDLDELKRKLREWQKKAAPLSRAIIEARNRIKDSVGAHLLAEIARGTDTEGPDIVPPVRDGEEGNVYAENPESSPFFRQLVFMKYGVTFHDLIHEMDMGKNEVAHRKWMAVHRDYWKMTSGHGHKDLKLKFNWDHFWVIIQGLDFGLNELTPEELAECLDEICPCGLRHSAGYYKKVRTGIKQACFRYRKPLSPP